jgi:ATP-dependent DNA ligase
VTVCRRDNFIAVGVKKTIAAHQESVSPLLSETRKGRLDLACLAKKKLFWNHPVMKWGKPVPIRRPPGFIEPCLPTLWHKPPSGDRWVHEINHDGFRLLVRKSGDEVRIFTRRGNGW